MLDLLRKIFGIQSPSRWGMTKREWKQLRYEIIKATDKAIKETEPFIHHIGIDLANGKNYTYPPPQK